MNLDSLHTHNNAYERAFEALCNQLFEQWLRREYGAEITHFTTVNGAGGDGGVEAYGILKQGHSIGVQAKWFRKSLGPGQIKQITTSVETARKVRPQLVRYIICLPRDFQSDKIGKQGQPIANTEERRLQSMIDKLQVACPNLSIELWNEYRLLTELQQPGNEGIRKYWFDREIITIDFLQKRFELARAGWLKERYIPALHTQGDIHLLINKLLYTAAYREAAIDQLQFYCDNNERALYKLQQLLALLDAVHPLHKDLYALTKHMEDILKMYHEEIRCLLGGAPLTGKPIQPFDALDQLRENISTNSFPSTFRNAVEAVTTSLYLQKMEKRPVILPSTDPFCGMITGGPAAGKTHGVTHAVSQRLAQGFPALIIQARSVNATSWAHILQQALGGLYTWSDFELFRALEAMAHTCDIERVANHTSDETLAPESTRVLICIDGIDEARDDASWRMRIGEVRELHEQYPRIVFVFTIRHIPLNQGNTFATKWHTPWMIQLRVSAEGDVPVATLTPHYLEHYDIRYDQSPWIQHAFGDALSLKLFCEEYAGRDLSTIKKAVTTSLTSLINNKIRRLTEEYAANSQQDWSTADRIIRTTLLALPVLLAGQQPVIREALISELGRTDPAQLNTTNIDRALDLYSLYGILNQEQLPSQDGLSPATTQFSITYQSYLDYFIAINTVREIRDMPAPKIPDSLKQPHAGNALTYTARILFEDHDLLMGENGFLTGELDELHLLTIQLLVLQQGNAAKVAACLPKLKTQFLSDGDARFIILRYWVKPCLRTQHHGLVITFLHDLLRDHPNPEAREIAWKSPVQLLPATDTLLNLKSLLELELLPDDQGDSVPLLLAWGLTCPEQSYREEIIDDLVEWAIIQPNEFIRLLNNFFPGHELQIQENLLMVVESVAREINRNGEGQEALSAWIREHTC